MQAIVDEINKYLAGFTNTKYSDWYVGIASSPQDRLFVDHSVSQDGNWVYAEAKSHFEARTVEQYFIDKLKTKGGPGGGDNTTKFVYAYLITNSTKE